MAFIVVAASFTLGFCGTFTTIFPVGHVGRSDDTVSFGVGAVTAVVLGVGSVFGVGAGVVDAAPVVSLVAPWIDCGNLTLTSILGGGGGG